LEAALYASGKRLVVEAVGKRAKRAPELMGMRVNQAFRFELDRQALARHVEAARQEWNRWKRENAPWWSGVSCAPQEAFRDLERALEN